MNHRKHRLFASYSPRWPLTWVRLGFHLDLDCLDAHASPLHAYDLYLKEWCSCLVINFICYARQPIQHGNCAIKGPYLAVEEQHQHHCPQSKSCYVLWFWWFLWWPRWWMTMTISMSRICGLIGNWWDFIWEWEIGPHGIIGDWSLIISRDHH